VIDLASAGFVVVGANRRVVQDGAAGLHVQRIDEPVVVDNPKLAVFCAVALGCPGSVGMVGVYVKVSGTGAGPYPG
jgi:hypothetical protein